jgi:hypothetical protein
MLEPTPTTRDITLYQGQTYTDNLQLLLDGVPAVWGATTAQWICKEKISDTEPFLSSSAPLSNVSLTLATDGWINVLITDETTAALTKKKGVYALYLHWADGTTWRLFEGALATSQGV